MKKFALISAMMVAISAVGAWAAACAETFNSDVLTIQTINENSNDQCVATFDATTEKTLSVPKDFTVNKVVLERSFNGNEFQTIVLPISSSNFYTQNAQFVKLEDIVKEENQGKYKWRISGMEQNNIIENSPYLLRTWNNAPMEIIGNGNEPIKIHKTMSDQKLDSKFTNNDKWVFRGTYTYKTWVKDSVNSAEIGHVYGFAATKKDTIAAGSFVRVASGAFIKPMRAYLYYNNTSQGGTQNEAPKFANGNILAKAAEEELPETIEVVIKDKDGNVMSIAQMNTITGEITSSIEGWFDLKGRRLNAKPTQKGTYFNNGKKVVIK